MKNSHHNTTVGIIGLGNIGEAIASSLVKKFKASLIYGFDIVGAKNRKIKKKYSINIACSIEDLLLKSNIIFLCVKPQDIKEVLLKINSFYLNIKERKIFVSVAAGISTKFLERFLQGLPVIRIMPNLGIFVGMSATAYCVGRYANSKDEKIVLSLLNTFGDSIKFPEYQIDKFTAVCGSGPAYVFYFFDAILSSSKILGLPSKKMERLIYLTFESSLKILSRYGFRSQELIGKVASKGGTTEQALKVFKKRRLTSLIQEAIKKAYLRAKQLERR